MKADTPSVYSPVKINTRHDLPIHQKVLLAQARLSLIAVRTGIESIQLMQENTKLVNAFTDPRLGETLNNLYFHWGMVSTLLLNDADRGRRESKDAYKARTARIEYVDSLLNEASVKVDLIRDRDARNSIAHVDERLADILKKPRGKPIGLFVDAGISDPDDLDPEVPMDLVFCRCYFIRRKQLAHLDREFSIERLDFECQLLHSTIFQPYL